MTIDPNADDIYNPATLAVIVTTAPRPKPTLERSIASMRQAGFAYKDTIPICADHMPDDELPWLANVKFLHQDLGGLQSWVWSLQYLYDMTKANWLMVCEDDIVWTRNCKPVLMAELEAAGDDVGYISLFLPRHNAKPIEQAHRKPQGGLPPGYYQSKLGWSSWGSQCLILPRKSAKALLQSPTFRAFVSQYKKNKNRDAVVAKHLYDLGLPLMYRVPCFVNHVLGQGNSALGNGDVRPGLVTDYFVEAL